MNLVYNILLMNTIRIDKYLAQLNLVSRREAMKFFRAGRVMINDYIEKDHGFHVIDGDRIVIDDTNPLTSLPSRGFPLVTGGSLSFVVKQSVTILLHKPA